MDFNKRWILMAVAALMCAYSLQVNASEHAVDEDNYGRPPPVPMEEQIIQAAKSPEDLNFFFDNNKREVKVEYDIILTLEQWAALQAAPSRRKRTVAMSDRYVRRWSNKVLNYEIIESHMTGVGQMDSIKHAIAEWSHYTCVKFKETSDEPNRVRMQNAHGCYSSLGMTGNVQVLGLAQGCRYRHIVLHELAHAMGIHHEQTHPDRDRYVTIKSENIAQGMGHNFQKLNWQLFDNFDIPYDYKSIMHYSAKAFSTNGQNTIETTDPQYQNKIGRYDDLSFGDIKTVNKMYDCGKEKPGCSITDEDCPKDGFVGKDCTCWCPGNPVKHCNKEDDEEKGDLTDFKFCGTDVYPEDCPSYARSGYCTTYKSYMDRHCSGSCCNLKGR